MGHLKEWFLDEMQVLFLTATGIVLRFGWQDVDLQGSHNRMHPYFLIRVGWSSYVQRSIAWDVAPVHPPPLPL